MAEIINLKAIADRGDVHSPDALIAAFRSPAPLPDQNVVAWHLRCPLEHKPLAELLLVHMGERSEPAC